MNTGHTPGPWKAGSAITRVEVLPEGWNAPLCVADCHAKNAPNAETERVANARLIASAPELLCMLQRLLDGVERLPEIPNTLCPLDVEQARAAIAKAEGK